MLLFYWLLIGPIIDLVKTFVKPIVIIAVLVMIDLGLGIGITQMVVNQSIQIAKDILIPDSIDFQRLVDTFTLVAIYG